MQLSNIIILSFIPIGLVGIYRPILLLYLFLVLPILEYVPHSIADLSLLELFKMGSISIYVMDYLIFIMAIVVLTTYFRNPRLFLSILSSPIAKICIIFFLWEIFIGVLSYSKGFGPSNILRRLSIESLMFIAFLVPLIDMTDIKKKRLFFFGIFLGMLLILFGLLKFFVFHEVELTSSATQRSLTGNSVHVFLFPLCYILFYNDSWKRHQWLSIFFVLMIALGINFAGHRSGWIVFLFVLSVWYMQHPKKIEFAWIPLLGISIVAILVIAFFSTNIQTGTLYGDFLVRIHDIFSMENASTQERLGKWELSMDIINENPLLGLGRFPMYTSSAGEENQLLVSSLQSTLDRSPHNLIMAQAVHEGLLGLTVLAIFFYVIFSQIEKIRIANLKYHNFFKVYILSFIIFSLFNTSFNNPSGKIYFFISLGLLNSEIFQNKNYLAGNKRLGYDLFRKTLPSIPEG